jgi:hypothetical protein
MKLYFAECKYTAPGIRLINVDANGSRLLTSFDIFATAGANTAVIKTFPVSVSNGILSVKFTSASSVANAMVSAIEIIPQ